MTQCPKCNSTVIDTGGNCMSCGYDTKIPYEEDRMHYQPPINTQVFVTDEVTKLEIQKIKELLKDIISKIDELISILGLEAKIPPTKLPKDF